MNVLYLQQEGVVFQWQTAQIASALWYRTYSAPQKGTAQLYCHGSSRGLACNTPLALKYSPIKQT